MFSGIIQLQGREQQNRQTGNNRIRVATERKAQRGRKEIKMKIDHINKKIYVTAAFLKRAGNCANPEFDEYRKAVSAFPDYEIVLKKKANSGKKLTFDFMSEYITTYETDEKQRNKMLNELAGRKEHAKKLSSSVYPSVKSWFIKSYPNWNEYTPTVAEAN